MLAWYRRLLALRRAHPALQIGSLDLIEIDAGEVLTFERSHDSATYVVALNMSGRPQPAPSGDAILISSTDGTDRSTLAPWEARITLEEPTR